MPQRGGRVKGVYLSLKGRLKKGFQTAFVCHAYDYALLGKANRTYAGMNVESEAMPSEKVSDGFLCAMRTITLC